MAVEDENQIFHLPSHSVAHSNPSLRQYPAGGVPSSALQQGPQGFGLLKGHLQSQSHNEDYQTGYRRFRVTDNPSPHQASDQHQHVVCWSRQCRFRARFVVENTTSYVRFQKTGSGKTDPCSSPRSPRLSNFFYFSSAISSLISTFQTFIHARSVINYCKAK
ncbi:uncharacterized protein LOC117152334 isoform X2 [Bombus impatiens]|uniref:Uncharacterized protein LOC117152334 isoform X2 n=1 Tax=Bombus impatiens TaxID=132113 RepID=A0A6P8LCG1_BOMIM|nr:uncharacterized protein LOC117152334 isoform X2 [Bombus impatiens]